MKQYIKTNLFIITLMACFLHPDFSYAQDKTLIQQIENALRQKRYEAALIRVQKLLSSQSGKDKIYGYFYYTKIALQWEKKRLPKEINMDKTKKYYQTLKKIKSGNIIKQKDLNEVIQLYERMFRPVLMVIAIEAGTYEQPRGQFSFRFTATHEDLLTPLQKKRYDILSSNKRRYQWIEFKQYELSDKNVNNYFFYTELQDIPVLQTSNDEAGYSLDFWQKRVVKDKVKEVHKVLEGYILPCNLTTLNKTLAVKLDVDRKLVESSLQPGYVRLDFKDILSSLDISGLDILNKNRYKEDGFLVIQADDAHRLELRIKDNKKSENRVSTIALPVAIGALAGVLFIISR